LIGLAYTRSAAKSSQFVGSDVTFGTHNAKRKTRPHAFGRIGEQPLSVTRLSVLSPRG
jgi:hypothetical protein